MGKELIEVVPVLPPRFADHGILPVPSGGKIIKRLQPFPFRCRRVYFPEIGAQRLPILERHKPGGVSDHVDDAELNARFGKDGMDRLGQAGQSINAGDEDVLHPAVFQFGHDARPELSALASTDPEAQCVLFPTGIESDGRIHGFIDHPAVLTGFGHYRVKVDDRIK